MILFYFYLLLKIINQVAYSYWFLDFLILYFFPRKQGHQNNSLTMYSEFSGCARASELASIFASIFRMSITYEKNSLSAFRNVFKSATIRHLVISFKPTNFSIGLWNFTNQFYSVIFIYFKIRKIFCENSLFLCKKNLEGWLKPFIKTPFFLVHRLDYKTLCLPITVSRPEVRAVFASHAYSASSSKTHLLTTRMCSAPLEIMSYFLPFLISMPSLNHFTCFRTNQHGY